MRHRILVTTSACLLAAALAPASAQQQTAAGAQKFLALLASDGSLSVQALDRTTGTMSVDGTVTIVNRWLKNGTPQNDGPYGGGSTKPSTTTMNRALKVVRTASTDARGNADDCTTRLDTFTDEKPGEVHVSDGTAMKETFFGYDELPYRVTTTTRYEDPAVKYAGPYHVVWGKAIISRGPGWIAASAQDSRFNAHLFFKSSSPDMADRVEYAMKFLHASCDKTAETGF